MLRFLFGLSVGLIPLWFLLGYIQHGASFGTEHFLLIIPAWLGYFAYGEWKRERKMRRRKLKVNITKGCGYGV